MGITSGNLKKPTEQTSSNNNYSAFGSLANFGKTLADAATLNAFDFNDQGNWAGGDYVNANDYKIQPPAQLTSETYNNFMNAYNNPKPGTLLAAKASDPEAYDAWLNSLPTDMQTKAIEYAGPASVQSPQAQLAIKMQNLSADEYAKKQNSFFGRNSDTIDGISKGIGAASSLGNIYLGFKQLDLAKKSANIAKEKLQLQKDEITHISNVRQKINSSYA